MPETPTPHEGEGFVVPMAEDGLITDAEKAEAMARESHPWRTGAADIRASVIKRRAENPNDPNIDKSLEFADQWDEGAQDDEDRVEDEKDAEKLAAAVPEADLENVRVDLDRQISELDEQLREVFRNPDGSRQAINTPIVRSHELGLYDLYRKRRRISRMIVLLGKRADGW